jgi:flagellar basal-body rod modification protein FlgD
MPTPVSGNQIPITTPQPVEPKQDEFGKDTFLKLLVAQLKYQDPLSPTDPQAFLAQSAQFTQVEKLTEMAEQMGRNADNQGLTTASALIGRTVSYVDGDDTGSGKVTGATITADGVRLRFSDTEDIALDTVTEIGV